MKTQRFSTIQCSSTKKNPSQKKLNKVYNIQPSQVQVKVVIFFPPKQVKNKVRSYNKYSNLQCFVFQKKVFEEKKMKSSISLSLNRSIIQNSLPGKKKKEKKKWSLKKNLKFFCPSCSKLPWLIGSFISKKKVVPKSEKCFFYTQWKPIFLLVLLVKYFRVKTTFSFAIRMLSPYISFSLLWVKMN